MKCHFCSSKNTIKLKKKIYCNNCEIYITEHNLPMLINIEKTYQLLCKKCLTIKNRKIHCSGFKEYLKKLPFCSVCKNTRKNDFKYDFFKHTSFYRKEKRSFNFLHLFLFLQNNFVSFIFFCYFLIEYFDWLIFIFFLLHFYFTNPLFYLLVLIYLYKKKKVCYEMPVFFNEFDLQTEISKLKISDKKWYFSNSNNHKPILVKQENPKLKIDKKVEDKFYKLKL
ncbi:hypothetical protein TUBRATIS_15090 [Tubulinosema ratisbonensis]|uniref:Uncharacterized protein n=1 Tax=Tubulinosema ratisbonensis TaxID=291195 RepID=A0A437ALB9_9MICR|nr:hypothetical protein TUBRATIS_15090 [Tubulinosema ratisbonensis]